MLALTLLLSTLFVGSSFAVHDEEFELDGNTAVDDPAKFDWESFFDGSGPGGDIAPIADPDPDPFEHGFVAAGAQADYATPDRTTYTQGSKDTQDVGDWTCTRRNNVGDKVDLLNAYSTAFRNNDGDLILYFGAELSAPEGNSNIGVWFLKDGTANCLAPATGSGATSFTGEHRDGDIFVVSEFTGGGTNANVKVYRWEGGPSGSLNPNPIGEGGFCDDPTHPDLACAIVNDAPITTPWNSPVKSGTQLQANQFFEGGVNISLMLNTDDPADECFARFLVNTRQSQSLTASIFDFTSGSLPLCGLTVEKVTDPAGGEGFDFNVSGPDTDEDFTLDDGGSRTFDDLASGSYTITEDVPAGWELISIVCNIDEADYTVDLEAGTATIHALEDHGQVTCTFTNRLRHSIVVEKVDDAFAPLDGAAFALHEDDNGEPGVKVGDFNLRHDHLFCIDNLVPGDYWVVETQTPGGFEPNDPEPVSSSSTHTCDERFDNGTLIGDPDVTIVNEPAPRTVTVTKLKEDTDVPLAGFEFQLFAGHDADPDTDTALETQTTGADGEAVFSDVAPGEYTLCETGASDPSDYWTPELPTCENITVDVGEDFVTTFENAPLAKVEVVFHDMTGFTTAVIECVDEADDEIGIRVHDTVTLDHLPLGEYDCSITIENGAASNSD